MTDNTPNATLIEASVKYVDTDRWVPQSFSLELRPGRLTLITGPSGCGKSTIIRTLNGLIPHAIPADYRGQVTVANQNVNDTPVAQLAKDVAIVMQDSDAQIVTTSVYDEVCFALENLNLPVAEINNRASQALAEVGLTGLENTNPWELSGGQRQRLLLATALAMTPTILILDEPTANLDPVATKQFYRLLPGILAKGTAIALVEHDVEEVIDLVDHVIALDETGALIAEGSYRHVYLGHLEEMSAAGLYPHSRRRAPLATATPETTPTLRLENITINHGTSETISNLSCTVAPGELMALIGRNGSGKTTLLQTIAGLQPWETGTITVAGQQRRPRRIDSNVGYVFQNPQHQFLTETVTAELELALRQTDLDPCSAGRKLDELLARFSLADYRNTNPFLLSGGQQRRLSVATALCEDRALLLLDEPTFGQDPKNAEAIMQLLADLTKSGSSAIIAVHDLRLAQRWCHQTAILHDGQLLAQGATAQILSDTDLLLRAGLAEPIEHGPELASAPVTPDICNPGSVTPTAKTRSGLLNRLNPLTMLAAVLPLVVTIGAFQHRLYPAAGIVGLALAALLLTTSAGLSRKQARNYCAAILALTTLLTFTLLPSTRIDILGESPTAFLGYQQNQWLASASHAIKVSAVLSLFLLSGVGTSPKETIVSLIKYLRLPYRIGYAGIAAIAFIPRYRADYRTIRVARMLRRSGTRSTLAPIANWFASVPALLASAIRHAEDVAMSMDARAFGAFKNRTEQIDAQWQVRDSLVLAIGWIATAALFHYLNHLSLIGYHIYA